MTDNERQAWFAMKDALQHFIDKCDSGRARSKRSYAEFKAALAEAALAEEECDNDAGFTHWEVDE